MWECKTCLWRWEDNLGESVMRLPKTKFKLLGLVESSFTHWTITLALFYLNTAKSRVSEYHFFSFTCFSVTNHMAHPMWKLEGSLKKLVLFFHGISLGIELRRLCLLASAFSHEPFHWPYPFFVCLFFRFYFYFFSCTFTWHHEFALQYLWRPVEGIRNPGNGAPGSCELPCEFWKLNLESSGKATSTLTTEPSAQPSPPPYFKQTK